jgi:sporulation protein YlmC with PRC-barrel domain
LSKKTLLNKIFSRFSIFFILVLSMLACNLGEHLPNRPAATAVLETAAAGQDSLPTPMTSPSATVTLQPQASVTPLPVETPPGEVAAPAPAGKPPQSQAAEIRPPERRDELTRLSALTGFQVVDRDGALLGTVSDAVVNTCETYLIYLLLDPAEGLSSAPGNRLIIPYEAVTINSGALDAQSRSVVLQLTSGQLSGAPAFPESLELIPPDWETEVRSYFSQWVRISNLTTECRVAAPGNDPAGGNVVVHKIAYLTGLIGAGLFDGLQNLLGTVEEAIFSPESGKLSFFVTRLLDGSGWVLVPLRVVNIPKSALEPGGELSLVLLTENDLLLNAPKLATIEEAVRDEVQGKAFQHWNR